MHEDITDSFNQWKEDLTEYVNARFELFKLETAESVARFWSNIVTKTVLLYFLLLALFFISFALAFYLGDLLQSNALGFLFTGFIYLLMVLIFYLLRKQIVDKPVIKSVLKLFFYSRNNSTNKD